MGAGGMTTKATIAVVASLVLAACASQEPATPAKETVPPFGYIAFCMEQPEHVLCPKTKY